MLTNAVVTTINGGVAAAAPAPTLSIGGLSLKAPAPQATVQSVTVRDTVTGQERMLDTAAVFVAIGHTPATEFVSNLVDTDSDGYISVHGASTVTSVPGIFAAGDCVDRVYRQAISAAGMGCRAALDAQSYLAAQE